MQGLLSNFVTVQIRSAEVDPELAAEYTRQREYLERSVADLKRQLTRDTQLHSDENRRIMQDNVALVKEINDLRHTIKMMRLMQREKVRLLLRWL